MVDIKEQGDDDDVSVGQNKQPREELILRPGNVSNYNHELFQVVQGDNQKMELKDAGTVKRTILSKTDFEKMAKAKEVSHQAGAKVKMGRSEMSTREKIMTKYCLNFCCMKVCICFKPCCCLEYPTGDDKIVVNESQRAIMFRYGRVNKKGASGAGRYTIYKGVDDYKIVNIQDSFFKFNIDRLLTIENLSLTLTCILLYQVVDPVKAVLNVVDWQKSVEYIAASIIRDKVGTHTLGDIIQNTETYQEAILKELAEITIIWGVRVLRIELKDFKKINEYLMVIETQKPAIQPQPQPQPQPPVTQQPMQINVTVNT